MKKQEFNKGEIIIYKTAKKEAALKVRLEKDTVWLTQSQIAFLFNTKRPAITKHLNNIFKNTELNKKSVCSILEHTAVDGKTYKTQFYNLDAIISVGYRVNSKQATQFRIWATKTLKEHLVKGYTINEKRLLQTQNRLKELQTAIDFIQKRTENKLLTGQEQEILNLLSNYSKTLTLLEKFDKQKLPLVKKSKGTFILKYGDAVHIVQKLKSQLISRKEAGDFFGKENDEKFKAILGNIYQTFSGRELYASLEEKAAHLLYFIIKDHPFIDGNKRTASFLFVYFLDRNNYLCRSSGEKKINDNALTALALLTAVSGPKDKDILIKITTNLLVD
ncbi:MAG TPA: virulence protein RhuM/Fic/DOC family protein [bacterium]|nr:virulence protein RhuM/Fic/DOC family protein [bacterium]